MTNKNRKQDKNRKQETGNKIKQETGNIKQETGNRSNYYIGLLILAYVVTACVLCSKYAKDTIEYKAGTWMMITLVSFAFIVGR